MLKYITNGKEFDFPKFDGTPKVKYVIASTPRSGSNMLTRMLWLTNRAGAPEEYLSKRYIEDFDYRVNFLERDYSDYSRWLGKDKCMPIEFDEYLNLLFKLRTSKNGAFGIKIHASHLWQQHLRNQRFADLFQNFKVIHMVRRDLASQAVSHLFATETGEWIDDEKWLNMTPQDPHQLEMQESYSRDRILSHMEYIEELDVSLNKMINDSGLKVIKVVYEELCINPQEQMRRVFNFLGIDGLDQFPKANINKQSSETKSLWLEKFKAEA